MPPRVAAREDARRAAADGKGVQACVVLDTGVSMLALTTLSRMRMPAAVMLTTKGDEPTPPLVMCESWGMEHTYFDGTDDEEVD